MTEEHLPTDNSPAAQLARKDKIIQVLMDRVEQGMDTQGSDYSFFQTAVLLGDKVKERTRRLDEALAALQKLNAALEREKHAAEAARIRLFDAISSSADGFALFDSDDRLIMANPEFVTLWGSDGQLLPIGPQSTFAEIMASIEAVQGSAVWQDQWQRLHENAKSGDATVVELMVREGLWIRISERPTAEGGVVATYANITEFKRSEDLRHERELAKRERLSHTVFEHTRDGLMITDPDGKIVEVNPAFTRISGFEAAEIVGQNPRLLKSGKHPPEFYGEMWATLLATGSWFGEVIDRRKDGRLYTKLLSISTVRDERGRVVNFVGSFQDITERKEAEEKIQFLAHHDVLTALPNRTLLRERFGHARELARRAGRSIAFMFLDLDEFKRINDSLGHRVGDGLLIAVVGRLKACLRESDTISRQGGDEFIVVLGDLESPVAAAGIATKILAAMAQPFEIDTNRINSSVSIGIAMAPADGDDFDVLLQRADTAMYHSKAQGRGRFSFFRQEMNDEAMRRHTLVSDLHLALERNELRLHYQPQVDLRDGTIRGAEALLRWFRSDGSVVGPDNFIAVAEETGLILPIGEWVMAEACRQARSWAAKGRSIPVAINVSGVQMQRADLPALLAKWTKSADIPASLVQVELTESTLMRDSVGVVQVLREIKGLGGTIAIDDFGTGYSSLSYLSHFPVDKLKIDRSFILGSTNNDEDGAIVRMIAHMAHTLNITAIAEGVETADQIRLLKRCDTHEAQGYYFSKPLDAADFERFLEAHGHRKQRRRIGAQVRK